MLARNEKEGLKVKKIIICIMISLLTMSLTVVPVDAESRIWYSIIVAKVSQNNTIVKGTKNRIKWKAVRIVNGEKKKTPVGFKSSNTKIATVSKKGVIKAKRKGSVKVTVYCKNSPKNKKTFRVKVVPEENTYLTSPIITPTSTPAPEYKVSKINIIGVSRIKAGRKATLTAKIAPDNASNKQVTWSSSNTSIAKVNNGVITALKDGKVTITCKA